MTAAWRRGGHVIGKLWGNGAAYNVVLTAIEAILGSPGSCLMPHVEGNI